MIDPATGERLGSDDTLFEAAAKESGRSTTLHWSEPPTSAGGVNPLSSSLKGPRIKLQPTTHYCHKESGEVGKDEIY